MAESKLSILVQAVGAAKASRELKGVDAAVSSIGARAGQGIRTATGNLVRLGTVAAGVAVAGLAGAVKAAADFESQLNTINTIARATPTELDAIGDGIRKVARDTGTPLADLSQGYYDLLSAGIAASDAQNVLNNANTLAIGGLSTTAEAVDLLTTAINVYGGDASQAAQFSDEFAKAIERGKVTASELAGSYAQVAPLAKEMGVENAELAAGFARLTASGTPAAEAATQMASAMTALLRKTPGLEKLEKATGKNYTALAGSKGLNVALEQMRVDAEKAGVELVDLVGRKEALLYILQSTGPNLRAYNDDLAAMGDAAGTAAGQMSERQKGLNYQLDRIKALAIDAGITIGSKLLPKLTPLAERAVEFLSTHEDDIEAFGDKIASGFDKAVAFAEKIPWAQVGAGLQIAAEWAGRLMDVFLNLPPEVQSTIIALAGLNKLSGGAITGIVGELGKGLIKGVLGLNAGVVNVRGAVVNTVGGPGAAGPGAGGAASTASWVRLLVPLAVAAAVVELGVQASGVNDPRHQMIDPNTGRSRTFRGTNVPEEQIANLERAIGPLTERAAGGDRDAARKLDSVRAEIARLRGDVQTQTTSMGRATVKSVAEEAQYFEASLARNLQINANAVSGEIKIARDRAAQEAANLRAAIAASGSMQASELARIRQIPVNVSVRFSPTISVSVRDQARKAQVQLKFNQVLAASP